MEVVRILVYPVKSLDPIELKEAQITQKGSLKYDRIFYIEDEKGKVVNGKREKRIHKVRCKTDIERERFYVSLNGKEYEFSFNETDKFSEVLSEFLGYRVFIKSAEFGLPDDTKAFGPTIIGDKTIEEISKWFNLPIEETLLRFRPNIVLRTKEPFEEEKLLWKKFYVGDVLFRAENISKRCPVPARNPFTGEEIKDFAKIFIQKRKENVPPWLSEEAFKGTFYRVSLNTNVLEGFGKSIKLGNKVKLVS